MLVRTWLQGPEDNALVQGVARDGLPVVEHLLCKGLALSMCPQIRLEAKGLDHRDHGMDRIQR